MGAGTINENTCVNFLKGRLAGGEAGDNYESLHALACDIAAHADSSTASPLRDLARLARLVLQVGGFDYQVRYIWLCVYVPRCGSFQSFVLLWLGILASWAQIACFA